MGWNEAVFHWINQWPQWLDPMFQLFSEGNKWWPVRLLLLGVFVAIGLRNGRRGWLVVLFGCLAIGVSNEICDLLKEWAKELRPCVELDCILRVPKLTSFGTASSHAANMAAVATIFATLKGR